jgi:hypothetical protein
LLAIAAVVVVANLPYLTGFVESDPLGPHSGLLASGSPGPLPGVNTIDPGAGAIAQANGHRAALDVLRLHVPWWNPYEGTGAPLAGGMQAAALFPPTWLAAMPSGQLYERLLIELLAGLATYLLLRRLLLGPTASVVGGTLFALNGTFAWFAFATHPKVMPFLPLLLLGIENAYAASMAGRRGGWRLIALAGALSFYAGFPEAAYINVLFALVWLVWRGARMGRARLTALLAKCAAGGVVAVLLGAPLLVAFLGYLPDTYLGVHDLPGFGHFHLDPGAMPQLLLPYVYGPLFAFYDPRGVIQAIWGNVGGYISITLLFFALLGAISPGRRGLKAALAGWIVLACARTYGAPVLGGVLGIVPGMGKVAFYRYASPTIELAAIVLAAFGLEAIATRALSRAAVVRALLVCLAALTAALFGARHYASIYSSVSEFWALLLILVLAPLARLGNPRFAMRVCGLVLVLDALLLFALPELSAPRRVTVDEAPVAYLRHHLGQSRFLGLGPIQPNYGSYFGLGSLTAVDLPVSKPFARYVTTRLDRFIEPEVFVGTSTGRRLVVPSVLQELVRNLDAYRAAAVAYVVTPRDHPLITSRSTFTPVFRSAKTRIYRVVGAAEYFSSTNRDCAARWSDRTAARLVCSAPTTLVRRETDLPGWTARVDGRTVPIRRYQGLFQAVPVGAGAHRVTFSYRPRHIGWGYAGFLAGCAWLAFSMFRRRSRLRTCRDASPGMPEACPRS